MERFHSWGSSSRTLSSRKAKSLEPHPVFLTQCWERRCTRKVRSSWDGPRSFPPFGWPLPCAWLFNGHTVDRVDRFLTRCLIICTRTTPSIPLASHLLFPDHNWKTASDKEEKSDQNFTKKRHLLRLELMHGRLNC